MIMLSKYIKTIFRFLGFHYIFVNYFLYNKFIINILDLINSKRWPKIELLMIIWPPSLSHFDQINMDVSKFCDLKWSKIIKIKKNNFDKFCYKIYEIDNASKRKITKKIDRIKKESTNIGLLKIIIFKPKILAQDSFNYVRCKTVNDIKIFIRNKYRNKIQDYVYDIIIHSSEVDYQNEDILKLIRENEETC